MANNETTSYLPPGESSADLYIERTNFASAIIGSFLYGVHFILFLIALHYLSKGKSRRNIDWAMLIYTVLLFCGSTLYMTGNVKWLEEMYIENRNYPGGPLGFDLNDFNTPIIIFGNAAYTFNNLLADALVLYRTWIVWNRSYAVVAFPLMMYLASTVLSILSVVQLARPGSQLFSHVGLTLALPYFSLSMALNIILTLMILVKLLTTRRHLRAILGVEHAEMYTGVAAMVVESAALYAICSIMFIATYSINNSLFNVFLPMEAQMMCIAPLLITIRVARGRAYSQEAISSAHSKMVFSSPYQDRSGTAGTVGRTNGSETVQMEVLEKKGSSGSGFGSATKIMNEV